MADDSILKATIEALLFISEGPLVLDKVRRLLEGVPKEQILSAIEELKARYDNQAGGIRIVEIAGGYQMVTASAVAPFLKKFNKDWRAQTLSKPALETLAIIAYKQPLSRAEIESLRNVNVDGVMRSLLDKQMIRVIGRKNLPGRPFVFGTTQRFLEHFGLKSLQDLPKMEDFAKLASLEPAGVKIQQETNTPLPLDLDNAAGLPITENRLPPQGAQDAPIMEEEHGFGESAHAN